MRKINEMYVIGIDHGYGNMKTANCCFPTGVMKSDTEPTFVSDLLLWNNKYYSIGVGHKEFTADKFTDEDYYVLTLAAIARELRRERITEANVFIAAGLPLTWVSEQKSEFKKYLLQHSKVSFTFRNTEYRIKIVGTEVYPQGFAAVAEKLGEFSGVNMLCDIGNGSHEQVRRYIRLTNLIPELLQYVDEGKIAFTPAVELSYLNEQEQRDLLEQMEINDCTPSLSQACRFKKLSQAEGLTPEFISAVMSEEKANQKEMFKVPMERIRKFAPKGNTKEVEDFVLKACEHYRHYLNRKRERDR